MAIDASCKQLKTDCTRGQGTIWHYCAARWGRAKLTTLWPLMTTGAVYDSCRKSRSARVTPGALMDVTHSWGFVTTTSQPQRGVGTSEAKGGGSGYLKKKGYWRGRNLNVFHYQNEVPPPQQQQQQSWASSYATVQFCSPVVFFIRNKWFFRDFTILSGFCF